MGKYIDKDVLSAEIKKRRSRNSKNKLNLASAFEDNYLLSFIDTLEVKEVDYRPIDKDFERDAVSFCIDTGLNTTPYIAKTIAKHFFELGIKAQKGE